MLDVPPLGHHFFINGIAMLLPEMAVARQTTFFRETQSAIESDPTHDLRVNEVLTFFTHFPNALILLSPMPTNIPEHLVQLLPQIDRDR